jgi:hypothetical protein
MCHLYQLIVLICAIAACAASAADVSVRAENFTVPPATGPVTHIVVRNAGDSGCTVTIEPEFPDGWQWTPDSRRVTLAPGEINRLPFTIERASDSKTNRYPIKVAVVQGSDRTVHRQNVVCASAPYFKPKIDGKFKDWADAIPATFTTGDKKTVVSTYWDKRNFYLYVQVEEDKLDSYKKNAAQVDAVQFALAARDAFTQSEPRAKAQRAEFLMVDVSGMFAKDKCFKLITGARKSGFAGFQRRAGCCQETGQDHALRVCRSICGDTGNQASRRKRDQVFSSRA